MSVIIRLQGLSWSASAMDIRNFFKGLSIPPGGVHIIGGERGDAFIAFSTDEDARRAMLLNNGKLNETNVMLFLSSKTEMQNTIIEAKERSTTAPPPAQVPVTSTPAINTMGQQLAGQLPGLGGIQPAQIPQINQLSQFLSGLLPNSNLTSSVVSKLMNQQHQQQQQLQQHQQQIKMPVSETPVSSYKSPYEQTLPGEYSIGGIPQSNMPKTNFMNKISESEHREMSPFGQNTRNLLPPVSIANSIPGLGTFLNQNTDNRVNNNINFPVNDGRQPWSANRDEPLMRAGEPPQRDKESFPNFSNTQGPPSNMREQTRWSDQAEHREDSFPANESRQPWSSNRNEPIMRGETQQHQNFGNSFWPPTSMHGQTMFPTPEEQRKDAFPSNNTRQPWQTNRNEPPPHRGEPEQREQDRRPNLSDDTGPKKDMHRHTRWSTPDENREDSWSSNENRQNWQQQNEQLPSRNFPRNKFDVAVDGKKNTDKSSAPVTVAPISVPSSVPSSSFSIEMATPKNPTAISNASQGSKFDNEAKPLDSKNLSEIPPTRKSLNTINASTKIEEDDGETEVDEFGRVRRKKPDGDSSSSKKDKRDSRERSKDRDRSKHHDSPRRDRDRRERDRDRRDRDRDRDRRDRDRDRDRRNRDRDDDRRDKRRDQDSRKSPGSSENNRRAKKRSLSPTSKNENEKKFQTNTSQNIRGNNKQGSMQSPSQQNQEKLAPPFQQETMKGSIGRNMASNLSKFPPQRGGGQGILGHAPQHFIQPGKGALMEDPVQRPDVDINSGQDEIHMEDAFNTRNEVWRPEEGDKEFQQPRFHEQRANAMEFVRHQNNRGPPELPRHPMGEENRPEFRGQSDDRGRGPVFNQNFRDNRSPSENRRGQSIRGPLLENPTDLRGRPFDDKNEFMGERFKGPPSLLGEPQVDNPIREMRNSWDMENPDLNMDMDFPPQRRGELIEGRGPARGPFPEFDRDFQNRPPEERGVIPRRFDGPQSDRGGFGDVPPRERQFLRDGKPNDRPFLRDGSPLDRSLTRNIPPHDRPFIREGPLNDRPFPRDGPPNERPFLRESPQHDRPMIHDGPPLIRPLLGDGPLHDIPRDDSPVDRHVPGDGLLFDRAGRPLEHRGSLERSGPGDRQMLDRPDFMRNREGNPDMPRPPRNPSEFGGRPRHEMRPRPLLNAPISHGRPPREFMGMPPHDHPDFQKRPPEDHPNFQEGPNKAMPQEFGRRPFPDRDINMNGRRPLLDTPDRHLRLPSDRADFRDGNDQFPGREGGPREASDFERRANFHEPQLQNRPDKREGNFERPGMYGSVQNATVRASPDHGGEIPPLEQPKNRDSNNMDQRRERENRRDNKNSNDRDSRKKKETDESSEQNKKRDKESKTRREPRIEGDFYVRIDNIPLDSNHFSVRKLFSECTIPGKGVKIINDSNGKSIGKAFIQFCNNVSLETGMKLSGSVLEKRIISVNVVTKKEFLDAIDSFEPTSDEEEETDRERSKKIDLCNTLTATLMNLQGENTSLTLPKYGNNKRNESGKESDKSADGAKSNSSDKKNVKNVISLGFVVKIDLLPEYTVISDIKNMFRECDIAQKGSAILMSGVNQGTRQCFVEFTNDKSLQKALKVRKVFRGNTISITTSTKNEMDTFSKEIKNEPSRQDRDRGQKISETRVDKIESDGDKVFNCIRITNLPYDFGHHDFRRLLEGINIAPRGIQVCHDALGQTLGEGCVELVNDREAKKGLEKDGLILGRNKIRVELITKQTLIDHMRHSRHTLRPEVANEPQVFYFVKASNLPVNVSTGEIINFFNGYQPAPESIRLNVGDTDERPNTSTALIGFRNRDDAEKAVNQINECRLRNMPIFLAKVIL